MDNSTAVTPVDVEQARTSEQRQLVVRPSYEIFILGLSILQLVNSILLLILPAGDNRNLAGGFFLAIALILIGDMLLRVRVVPRRIYWLRKLWGWMLIVGSVPVPFLIVFRLWRTRRLLSLMKEGDLQTAMGVAIRQRAGSLLLVAVLAAVVVLEFGSLFVLQAEEGAPGANIETGGDAVWWALVTVATVGYGDQYPVTTAGRLTGVLVMITGVGLFSVLTSFMAQSFVRSREEHAIEAVERPAEQAGIEDDLAVIRRLLDEQEATMSELRAPVHRLEQKREK